MADQEKTHPGFTITCNTCGSTDVHVDIEHPWVHYDVADKSEVTLECWECHATAELHDEPHR